MEEGGDKKRDLEENGKGRIGVEDILWREILDSPLPFASSETRTFQHQGQLPALQAHWEHSAAGSRKLSGSFGSGGGGGAESLLLTLSLFPPPHRHGKGKTLPKSLKSRPYGIHAQRKRRK